MKIRWITRMLGIDLTTCVPYIFTYYVLRIVKYQTIASILILKMIFYRIIYIKMGCEGFSLIELSTLVASFILREIEGMWSWQSEG